LTLGGKKKKLSKAYFDAYGQNLGLNKKQIEGVYRRFIKNKSLALKWIEESFLSDEMKGKYVELIEERYIHFSSIWRDSSINLW
jgi:serine/threonine-protein kinase HipA